jgi:glutamate carboxypeptidase
LAETKILEWLSDQKKSMIALLEKLVNTDSGSNDKLGVDAAGQLLTDFFYNEQLEVQIVQSDTFGDAIVAELPNEPSGGDQRPVVLLGHRDTVFPKGEASRRPFKTEGNLAYGPGVADMKAGLVMNAYVIAGFKRFGGQPAALVALITGDEEIASPFSRPLIEGLARRSRATFSSEPSSAMTRVVRARKGALFMRLEVFGKAAHAGANPQDGVSAIEELARKIVKLHALTDFTRGTTVNVGMVNGGQSINTIAPYAVADVELRYNTLQQKEVGFAVVQDIVNTSFVAGTHATLTITGEFLPLEENDRNQKLLAHYKSAAKELGHEIEGIVAGGGADSGLTSAVGCPTLCSVGPVGGKGHSMEEYVDIDSLVPRSQILALAISTLGENL